jgi:hypothetical protein
MNDAKRSIFREDALRRYAEGRDRPVLPRYVSPRIFAWLWTALGLLLAAGAAVWLTMIGRLGG